MDMVIQTTPSLAAKITKPARGKARKAVSEKSQQHSENWPQAQKSITVGPDRSSIAMTACRTSGRMKRISSSPRATVETVSPSAPWRQSWLAIGLREQKTRGAICLLLIAKKCWAGHGITCVRTRIILTIYYRVDCARLKEHQFAPSSAEKEK